MRMGIPAARTNHSYANAAAITAIPPNQRQDGDEAFNADTGVGYHFDADAVAGGLNDGAKDADAAGAFVALIIN